MLLRRKRGAENGPGSFMLRNAKADELQILYERAERFFDFPTCIVRDCGVQYLTILEKEGYRL